MSILTILCVVWGVSFAIFLSIIIFASIFGRARECNRCEKLYEITRKELWSEIVGGPPLNQLCPACERADSIFASNRDWPECDLPEAADLPKPERKERDTSPRHHCGSAAEFQQN